MLLALCNQAQGAHIWVKWAGRLGLSCLLGQDHGPGMQCFFHRISVLYDRSHLCWALVRYCLMSIHTGDTGRHECLIAVDTSTVGTGLSVWSLARLWCTRTLFFSPTHEYPVLKQGDWAWARIRSFNSCLIFGLHIHNNQTDRLPVFF